MSIEQYIDCFSSPEPAYLADIARQTNLYHVNPHQLSGHLQGRLLALLTAMMKPSCALELGTFTGYSALCIAEGLPENTKLITVEKNDELEDTITRNFSRTPLGQKIQLVIDDACHFLQTTDFSFDFVFMDADKRLYPQYLDLLLPHLTRGAFILADNTLWDNHVIDPAYDHDAQTKALRLFNRQVAQNPNLQNVILPIRDGLNIIRYCPL